MKMVKIAYSTPLDALIEVATRMGRYENKYGMKSPDFLRKYQSGEMPCEDDFMEWAIACGDLRYLREKVEERAKEVA